MESISKDTFPLLQEPSLLLSLTSKPYIPMPLQLSPISALLKKHPLNHISRNLMAPLPYSFGM